VEEALEGRAIEDLKELVKVTYLLYSMQKISDRLSLVSICAAAKR